MSQHITIDRDDLLDALRAETPHEFLAELGRILFSSPTISVIHMALVEAQQRWPDIVNVTNLEDENADLQDKVHELEEEWRDNTRTIDKLEDSVSYYREESAKWSDRYFHLRERVNTQVYNALADASKKIEAGEATK